MICTTRLVTHRAIRFTGVGVNGTTNTSQGRGYYAITPITAFDFVCNCAINSHKIKEDHKSCL